MPDESEPGAAAFVADLVGSTALGERLDVEDVAAAVGAAVAAVVMAVETHGGQVRQLAGDGVMAEFPVPSVEGHVDAIRAGVVAVTRVAELAEEAGTALALRVGVECGGGTAETAAFDLAAALEAAAPPGSVLAGPRLHARLEHVVGWAPGPDIDVARGARVGTWRPQLAPPRSNELEAPEVRDAPGVREERKVVAALFLGTNPTRGSATVDAAAAHARQVVERYEGVARNLAGGITVAFFGAPAHEDDVERAVRAGLEAVRSPAGRRAGARAGLTVGPAALVLHGAGHHVEHTALGDVMNTAARLLGAAAAGELLCTSDLHRRVASRFSEADRRQLALKGKSAPVEAVVVGGERTGSLLAHHDGPLVGREDELALLRRHVEAHRRGARGRLVLIEGDAGVGKSALVAAACTHAANGPRPLHLLLAGCASHAQPLPYWPLRHAAASLLDDAGELGGIAPGDRSGLELVAGRGQIDRGPHLSADALHDRAVAAFADRLRQLSRGSAVLLVVEDLHWADPQTIEVLDALIADGTALVVGTRRPVTGHGSDRLADLAGSSGAVVRLRPLGAGQDRALLDAFFERAVLPADLEQQVLVLADGNPLFLGELCRHLVDQGVVVRDEHGWRFAGAADLHLPDTVQRVVLARADRLPRDARTVLDVAALAGEIDVTVLQRAIGDRASTGPALRELERLAIVEHDGERVTFPHVVIAEAIAETILRRDRRQLHLRLAHALAELRADVPELWGTLAWHASGGGDAELAHRFAEPAGTHALAHLAFEQAARHFDLAIRAGNDLDVPESERCRLLLRLGRARHAAGLLEAAMDAFREAAHVADRVGNTDDLAAAALGFEAAFFDTRRPRTADGGPRPLLQRALAASESEALRARLLAALASDHTFAGERRTARKLADESIALARSAGGPAVLARALHAWGLTRDAPGESPARLDATTEMERAASEAGDGELALEAGRLRLVEELRLGRMGEASETIRRVEALAQDLGQPRYLWYPAMWRAMWQLQRGDLDEAEACIEAFVDEGRRRRYADATVVHAVQTFLLRREQRRASEVAPLIRALQARDGDDGAQRWEPILCALAAELGQREEASRIVEDYVRQDFAQIPDDQSATIVVALLADASACVGHRAAAAGLYSRAVSWAGEYLVVGSGAIWLGSAAHVLGVLAGAAGRRRVAVDHLEQAYAANLAAGSEVLAAHSAVEAACALAGDDPEGARQRLDDARELADGRPTPRLRHRITEVEHVLAGRRAHPHPHP